MTCSDSECRYLTTPATAICSLLLHSYRTHLSPGSRRPGNSLLAEGRISIEVPFTFIDGPPVIQIPLAIPSDQQALDTLRELGSPPGGDSSTGAPHPTSANSLTVPAWKRGASFTPPPSIFRGAYLLRSSPQPQHYSLRTLDQTHVRPARARFLDRGHPPERWQRRNYETPHHGRRTSIYRCDERGKFWIQCHHRQAVDRNLYRPICYP